MSRTDKTQPYRVRLWDGTLTRIAVHNHSDGICDLPADYREDVSQYAATNGYRARTSCYWAMHFTGTKACCCSLCHDPDGLRAERRSDRHHARRELVDLVKLAQHDWRDLV